MTKKLILLGLMAGAAALMAFADVVGIYDFSKQELSLPPASTNSLIIDVSQSSGVGLEVYFTVAAGNGTLASVTLTNIISGATNSAAWTNILAGSTDVFLYTNVAVTNAVSLRVTNAAYTFACTPGGTDNFGQSQTNALPYTNWVGPNAFTIVTTNTLIFTNSIGTNTNAICATNILAFTAAPGANTFTAVVTNNFTVTNAASTNVANLTEVNYFVLTNLPNQNFEWLMTNAAPQATTNLALALASFYGNNLIVAYGSPTNLLLTTPGGATYTGGILAGLGTVTFTTNAIANGLVLTCSNSVDKITWFSDAAHTFTRNFSSTNTIDTFTNFTAIGNFRYWQYTLQNASNNYANIPYFALKKALKQGQ